ERIQRLFGVSPGRLDREDGSFGGCQGEDRQNALAVNSFAIFDDFYPRLKTVGQLYEHVSRPRVQALRVGHRYGSLCPYFAHSLPQNGASATTGNSLTLKLPISRHKLIVVRLVEQLQNLLRVFCLLEELAKRVVAQLARNVFQRAQVVAGPIR